MPIYDKPTRELMHEFAAQRLTPGQVFSRKDAVRWFAEHYPDIKSNTVGLHVDGMSVNSTQRRHHPSIKKGGGFDLFFKLGPSEFRLWDRERDTAPRYKADLDAAIEKGAAGTGDFADEAAEEDDIGSRKFAFERDLQNYLVQNLGLLEPGLKLYEDEDGAFTGVEFPAGGRYIDILAVGPDDACVTIEPRCPAPTTVSRVRFFDTWAGSRRISPAMTRSEASSSPARFPRTSFWQLPPSRTFGSSSTRFLSPLNPSPGIDPAGRYAVKTVADWFPGNSPLSVQQKY